MPRWVVGDAVYEVSPQSQSWSAGPVTFKVRRPQWRPSDHPRDHHGRFVETGDPVQLLGGTHGTFQGVDAATGRIRVRVAGEQHDRLVQRRHVEFGGKPSQAAPKPPAKPAQAKVPLEPSPPSPIVSGPGGVSAVKVDMADSQRNSINDLLIDDPALNYGISAREGAAALRAKQPLTASQAEALAAVVRARAQSSTLSKAKQKSLSGGALRLDTVVAQLRGFKASAIPTSDKASPISVETVKAGDVLALPGKGGKADVRTVTEVKPWYGFHKFTLANANGETETRFIASGTPLYKFHGDGNVSDAVKVDDKTKQVGDEPSALYDDDEAVQVLKDALIAADGKKKADPDVSAAATEQGPGGVPSTVPWFDQLSLTGANTDPVPVTGLTIEGYTVTNGIAYRRNGRSYLVELKPGETAGTAKQRGDATAAMLESVLNFAPDDKAALQRGLALLQGPNPADSYWAAKYNMPGFHSEATGAFGGTTIWSGQDPKPTTLAHEFGHTVDSQGFGVEQWLSQADGPVVPGQEISWKEAQQRDRLVSSRFAKTFKESSGLNPSATYNYVKPITPDSGGVTEYGAVDPREDFAESVRLWMKDRREGGIGTLTGTGDKVRFSDLFPERAKVLDAAMGTQTDFNTALRKKHSKVVEDRFLANMQAVENDDTADALLPEDLFATAALPRDEVIAAFTRAQLGFADFKKDQEAKKKAKEAAEKLAAEQAAAKAKAEAEVASVTAALENGKLEKADAKKFRLKTTLYKNKLRDQGYSEAEIAQMAAAYETALMHEHFKLGAFAHPKLTPDFSDKERDVAGGWLIEAGLEQHPLAQKQQFGKDAQAEANMAAELADRLNNPADWAAFAASKNTHLPSYPSGEGAIKEFDAYSPKDRHGLLASEVSRRVGVWAGTSGDNNENAVLMQEAVKREFGLPESAPSAPRMTKAKFDDLMQTRWPTDGPWYQRVARVMHDHTQDEFKKAGITHVSLYRGMKFPGVPAPEWAKTSGAKRVPLQPINSWTTSKGTSSSFSGQNGVLLKASIPVELVLGTGRTGFGTMFENEFVVFDNDGDIMVKKL